MFPWARMKVLFLWGESDRDELGDSSNEEIQKTTKMNTSRQRCSETFYMAAPNARTGSH